MLAQSTSHCYFVLPDLHKVLPSTTLYYKGLHKILPSITLYYKGRTKHVPAPLVLQNLHHVFPYTTCTTKLAHISCKGKILRTEVFTQSKLLHTVSFCAEKPLHTASFSPLSFYTPQAFTPRSFDNKLLHEGALHTARQTASFYTQKPLREAFTQFYTNLKDMLHTKAFMVLRAMAPEITVPLQNRISGPKQKKQFWSIWKDFVKGIGAKNLTNHHCNLDAATSIRFAMPPTSGKHTCIYADGNTTWQQPCSHSNAICNRRFPQDHRTTHARTDLKH